MDVGGGERNGQAGERIASRLSRWRRGVIFALLAAAIVERVAWSVASSAWSAGGEAFLVAYAFSQGHGFASAYGLDHGATAHLLPISPGLAGTVYWLLGYTPLAELVLAAWSIGLALGSYLLLDRAFARLGVGVGPRLLALAFLCLAPTYIAQEAVDFRVWEGGLAAFLSALMLDQALAADREDAPRRHVHVVIAAAPLLFFVNPLMGAAAFLSLALLWAGRVPLGVLARRMTMSVLLLAMFVVPWAIRNQRVLGEPVLLRSNAGLELALAHYPGVPVRGDRDDAFVARLHAIHPLQSREARATMVARGGELAYSRALGNEAMATIAANPGRAVAVMLAHVGDMITPGPWIFRIWGIQGLAPIQSALATMVGLLGIGGLIAGLGLGGRRWLFVAIPIIVPVLAVAPFQPVMRYTYLIYAPLAFCGACGLSLLVEHFRRQLRRRRSSGSATGDTSAAR